MVREAHARAPRTKDEKRARFSFRLPFLSSVWGNLIWVGFGVNVLPPGAVTFTGAAGRWQTRERIAEFLPGSSSALLVV
jgi:hypothetical protein